MGWDDDEVADDPERAALLRETAEDVRATGDEGGEMVAALLYRVSDLYDPEESTSTNEVYLGMRTILGVRERDGEE